MDSDNLDNNDQEFWALVEEEFMDDSDEEQQLQNSGSPSRRKRRTTIDRGREEGHNRLFNDYFSENPVYTDVQFRRSSSDVDIEEVMQMIDFLHRQIERPQALIEPLGHNNNPHPEQVKP
ncbi:hypothetical protein KIW84_031554 [Lathyrus oleraceus]|uniref:Uncharacterized protein n=1 Tax=Pisum sativum TaxID=3888 RepID=A0A9D4XTD8_PEA|nr:hypothetical protein KIW84_031554 [Pisum sativum]